MILTTKFYKRQTIHKTCRSVIKQSLNNPLFDHYISKFDEKVLSDFSLNVDKILKYQKKDLVLKTEKNWISETLRPEIITPTMTACPVLLEY